MDMDFALLKISSAPSPLKAIFGSRLALSSASVHVQMNKAILDGSRATGLTFPFPNVPFTNPEKPKVKANAVVQDDGASDGHDYALLLVDSPFHTMGKVMLFLTQLIPFITPEKARALFYEARETGYSVIAVTSKDEAKDYSASLLVKYINADYCPTKAIHSGRNGYFDFLLARGYKNEVDNYVLLLVDSPFHTEWKVMLYLPQLIPCISHEKARALCYEARERGSAVIIVTSKVKAMDYSTFLKASGINADYRPAN